MRLPEPVYNAVPALYILMGIATWYFAVEAIVLERGEALTAFLSTSALLLIGYGLYTKRLKRRKKAALETQN